MEPNPDASDADRSEVDRSDVDHAGAARSDVVVSEAELAAASGARPRVFSGVQPSGDLHLGTYLGALRQWAQHQVERDNIFCVVDLHALTVPEDVDPSTLRAKSREVAALYLASGIDPESSIVFVQSHVREHAELTWLLNCTTPLGWLYRMTQFKSKSEGRESVSTGLLDYPVLQAADILLYDTDVVPVGEDQVQHVELTRDIAQRFNHLFGPVFRLPKAVVPKSGARVMGFDDPEVKMSKSYARVRDRHAVHLLDDETRIKKTVMSAVTDSGREVRFEHAGPGVRNLLSVLQSLTNEPMDAVEARFEGKGYGDLKKAALEAILATLRPIQERYREYAADPAELDAVLARGADRAREQAATTLARAKTALGVGT
ncbi:MAG: tryptophan--tRNA ligase [Trueperaceae bacterium]|nr:tryptophan--tRNA ligase [Trueperaceae bacterium]